MVASAAGALGHRILTAARRWGLIFFPTQSFPFHNSLQRPLPPGSPHGVAARNRGRGQLPALIHTVALGPPHLSVPLIGDSLDLNLFPPHLLRGSSVLGRGGDRWVAGLGTPHTVLMNGLGPVLSSWSAGHLLHSLLGREGHGKTVSPSNPQPCSLGTQARSTAPLGEAVSVLKMRTGWQPEGTACHSQAQAGPHTQSPGLWSRPFPYHHCCPQVPGQMEYMELPDF